jgi:hypothetical protein
VSVTSGEAAQRVKTMRILKRRYSDKHVVKRSWRLFWQSLALATTEDVAHVGCRPASFIWFRE